MWKYFCCSEATAVLLQESGDVLWLSIWQSSAECFSQHAADVSPESVCWDNTPLESMKDVRPHAGPVLWRRSSPLLAAPRRSSPLLAAPHSRVSDACGQRYGIWCASRLAR
ncbi:unnamed protein product [Merluccius merluccius]